MATRRRLKRRERKEGWKIAQQIFKRNALSLIDKMVELKEQAPDAARCKANALVDEILHSIFFLGNILEPSVSPEDFVTDAEMLQCLRERFPRPFEFYSSQLPRRSPFSCVLDMIVLLLGQQNESVILDGLRMLMKELNLCRSQGLVSSTICVSHRTVIGNQDKYYGVCMSAPTGHYPRRFLIAASCLSSWDKYVAGAVMTYLPIKTKKPHFDGTIKLPPNVRCQAFDLFDGNDKHPCRSCGNLFGLETREENESVYGNCAEVESLSNLFKNDVVKDEARPETSTMYSEKTREGVENYVKAELKELLKEEGRFIWRGHFYSPQ